MPKCCDRCGDEAQLLIKVLYTYQMGNSPKDWDSIEEFWCVDCIRDNCK